MVRFPIIRPDVPEPDLWRAYVDESQEAGRFSNFGPLSLRLEREIASTWGTGHSICVLASTGTAAISAPLIARGITGPVLVPAFTFPATLAAVRMAHAQPLVMDVDRDEWLVTPQSLEDALSRTRARAAVLVAPFGLKGDFAPHAEIARRHAAVLVIDNAAGLGSDNPRRAVGPDVFEACSLHATKPFAIGEGGAIFASADQEAALRRALNFGLPDWNSPPGWGINGKLPEVQAAIGLAVARRFAERLRRRRHLASRYIDVLDRFSGRLGFCRPSWNAAWQLFPILLPNALAVARFSQACADLGMETRRYYSPALSRLPGVDLLEPCPVAEDLSDRMCCVPVYATYDELEAAELSHIVSTALTATIGPGECDA